MSYPPTTHVTRKRIFHRSPSQSANIADLELILKYKLIHV